MKRIGVFGCKTTTQFILEDLIKTHPVSQLVTIDPALGAKNRVADYCDLKALASSLNINVYQAKTYGLKDSDDVQTINEMNLDVAFVIGWQRLLPENILLNISTGAFGMHGSSMNLPLGRGRSPMNWSIIENRKFFYTNLIKYDVGVDSGDILDTFLFSINSADTAETLHFKNTLSMKFLIKKNLSNILENNFVLKKQIDVTPTYYPKRQPNDSLIDWSRDIFYLERHIRAVAKPFNGAYTFIGENKVIIHRAAIFETELVNFGYDEAPTGSVVELFPNGKFLVRCQGGLLIVHEYESPLNIRRNDRFANHNETVHYFELNNSGYHDLANS